MDIKKILRAFQMDVLVLLIFGGTLIRLSSADMFVSLKPSISFEQMLNGSEVKAGDCVAGNVLYALDSFAAQSTYTRRSDGSRSGSRNSGKYYLIPTSSGYVGLKSRQSDVEALDTLSEETFQYLETGSEPTTTLFMQGSVKVMEDSLVKYYTEYLEDLGYTEAEIQSMGEPLVIQYTNFTAVRIMFAAGIVLIVLAFLLLRLKYKRILRRSRLNKAEDLPNLL